MFWMTKGTYTKTYPDIVNYKYFSPEHLLVFGICVGVIILLAVIYRKLTEENREKFIKIAAVLLIIDELIKHIGCLATGQWNPNYLPLHLCSINIFVCCLYAIRPSKLTAEILYATCLPGAVIALLMPTWNALPYWNFMTIHSTTVHILLALFPAALLAGGFRPNFRRLPKVFGVLLAECVPIYFFNKAFNTNFFFLNGTETNPLLEFLASFLGESLYIAALPVLLVIVWFFMYFPWEMKIKKVRQ